MRNQPSLRTSSGAIWIVVGTLFVAVSLVPLVLIAGTGGPSATIAIVTIIVLVALLTALVVVRITVREQVLRLRLMAGSLLAIAAVALIGMLLCLATARAG